MLRDRAARGDKVRVLIVTARDAVSDRVAGLDAGADDYLVKPFSLEELAARMRAVLRRDVARGDNVLTNGDIALDQARAPSPATASRSTFRRESSRCSPPCWSGRARRSPRHSSRSASTAGATKSRATRIEVHVHNLRRKLGADAIRTIRGVGYVIARA